jgi:hypothetical protein
MKLKGFLVLIITTSYIFADGGSGYTRIGLGDMNYSFSPRRTSFGGLGAAVSDKYNVSDYNPASWTRLSLSRLEAGLRVESFFTKDQNKNSFFSNAYFSGFILGIPVQKDYGISLVMGIVPYSRNKLNISTNYSNYKYTFEESGNVTKLFIGTSYSLPFELNAGASLDYYVGNEDLYSDIYFSDETSYNSEYHTKYKHSGISGTFGLISNDLSKTFNIKSISNLRIGTTLSLSSTFTTDTALYRTVFTGNKDKIIGTDTVSIGNTKTKLPFRIGAGLSFTSGKYLFLVDYLYQPWSQFRYSNLAIEELRDAQKISAGFEYQVSSEPSSGFWRQVIYRAGISYEETQYKVKGKGINQFSVTGGFAIPLEYGSSVDLAVEYGMRGTTELNLIKENFFKLNISVNFGELWFFRGGR